MKQVKTELFVADYEALVAKKEEILVNKEAAIALAKEQAEGIILQYGYSDAVKEALVTEVVAEKEKEFDLTAIDAELAIFEKYLEEVVEEIEEEITEDCEAESTDDATPEFVA